MRRSKNKSGFTLAEMVVVVAIIAILVSTVVSVVARIDSQAKEQLTRSTIVIISSALEQFGDYKISSLFSKI